MIASKIQAPNIGKAGELRVRSELMFRGLTPAACDQDNGIDIIICDNKKTIQVKTSLKAHYSKKDYSYRYSFSIRQSQFRSSKDGLYERVHTRKNYSGIDYFVFFCVEHDIFYIVPEKEIGEKVSFCIATPDKERKYNYYKEPVSKYEKYKNNWDLLK